MNPFIEGFLEKIAEIGLTKMAAEQWQPGVMGKVMAGRGGLGVPAPTPRPRPRPKLEDLVRNLNAAQVEKQQIAKDLGALGGEGTVGSVLDFARTPLRAGLVGGATGAGAVGAGGAISGLAKLLGLAKAVPALGGGATALPLGMEKVLQNAWDKGLDFSKWYDLVQKYAPNTPVSELQRIMRGGR